MPKVAIVDQWVSAGGGERFVHGLVSGVIEAGLNEKWEIVIVRARLNSAGVHLPWPEHLLAPGIRVEYIDMNNSFNRIFSRMFSMDRILGIRGTGYVRWKIGSWLRKTGTVSWKALCGDMRSWIENYFRHNRFDVVYFSWPYFLDAPRLKIPMVATPHDFIYKYGLTVNRPGQKILDRQIPKWLEACSQIVVSTQFVADEIRKFYPSWAHKAQVVRPGTPISKFAPTAEQVESVRREHGLPERFALVVGWLTEHKNQMVVFEAIAKLRDRGVRIPVVCVGPNSALLNEPAKLDAKNTIQGGYPWKVLEFCRRAKLVSGADYFALGYVDDSGLECLYRCASMLIVPTLVEAESLPSREAIRLGCPVVFANVPVHQEQIRVIEENSWTFPPHDSSSLAEVIATVAKGDKEVLTRVRNAQEIVVRVYSWARMAREYFAVFERVAGLRPTKEADAAFPVEQLNG